MKQTGGPWRLDETYLKIKGKWHYLYRAVDKAGQTLDWMLSHQRNKKEAFPPTHTELQEEKLLPSTTKLRQVKYLNNSVENDHKFVKSKSRYRQWYQSFNAARRTIDGMETMRMIQKGQVRYIAKDDICAQNNFICRIFGLAA